MHTVFLIVYTCSHTCKHAYSYVFATQKNTQKKLKGPVSCLPLTIVETHAHEMGRPYCSWLCQSLRNPIHAVTPLSPPAGPEVFHLQQQSPLSLLPPASWQPQIPFISHELDHSSCLIQVEPCNVHPVCLAYFTTACPDVSLASEMNCRYLFPKPQLPQT